MKAVYPEHSLYSYIISASPPLETQRQSLCSGKFGSQLFRASSCWCWIIPTSITHLWTETSMLRGAESFVITPDPVPHVTWCMSFGLPLLELCRTHRECRQLCSCASGEYTPEVRGGKKVMCWNFGRTRRSAQNSTKGLWHGNQSPAKLLLFGCQFAFRKVESFAVWQACCLYNCR
jgi:hypothetical protein